MLELQRLAPHKIPRMKQNKITLLTLAVLAASVSVSQAQTLLLRMPFTDTGAGTTCASDTSAGGANVTLNMLNMSGAAADFHGTPGGGVSGLNVALDFSTNSDFSGSLNNPQNGPIAENTSTALNFGVLSAYTATIWFKPLTPEFYGSGHYTRIFTLGQNGTLDKGVANSLGVFWNNSTSINCAFNTGLSLAGSVQPGAFAVGQWYFIAVTYDGSTATIYQGTDNGINGNLTQVAQQAFTGGTITLTNVSGSVLMVGNQIARGRPFDGWLDDFRFYSGAASASLVEDIRWSALAPIVAAAPGNNQVILTFTNLTGAASYTVSNAASIGGPYTQLVTGWTSTSYTDTTAVNGTTSYYIVSAVDANGGGTTSQNSQPVAATPEPPPTTPQFVTATASNAAVYLSWSASTGVPAPITYNLAKSTNSGSEVLLLNTSGTSYKDTNVANGVQYFYTVTAVNAAGELSATSPETNSTPIGPPAAPAQAFADAVSGGVLVSWTAVPGATSYNVLRSTTGAGGAYTTIAPLVTGTSYLDASGVLGDYYEVVAVGPGGSSGSSSPADAVPQLFNVNFDSAANGNNYGGGEVPPPSAMSGAAVIGSPGDIWNGVNDGGANPATYTAGPLVNADGSSSLITLSLSAPGGEFDDNAPAFNSFSPFAWASVANMNADIGYPNSPYAVLMSTLLSASADGYVELGGLTPNAAYTLYVYSAGNTAGRTSTFWVTQGTAASPGAQQGTTQTCTYDDKTITLVNGVDYLVFTNAVADTNGNLTINWGNGGVSENDFCGFQLVQGAVLGASITPPNLNNQTLCTNTTATFTAASGSINGSPTTTIVRFTNIVTTSALGSSVSTSTTNVYTANGTFSGTVIAGISNGTATLTLPLTKNLKYSVKVTAVPAAGAPLVTSTTFDTFAPSLVIESSDYNFSSGSWHETPANGGVWFYYNATTPVAGTPGVDFFKSGGEGPNALFYRDLSGGTYVTEANADTFSEQKDALATTGSTIGSNSFPELSIGYDTVGDWWNYTRTFGASGYPADSASNGTYNVWLYMSISGGGEDATLSTVTPSPPTTTSQTVTPIGQFGTASFAENDWNGYEYVPMTDAYGNLLATTIGSGVQTFQLQVGPSGGPNVGFMMLMPATPVLTPGLSYIYPDGTRPFEPTNTFAFTVTPNNGSNILTSGIDLVLNGVDVSAGLKFTAGVGNTWKVTYPILYNAVYAAVINVTNTAGVYSTFPISFDTFNVNYYQWEAVDYDFSTNNGNFSGPPAQQGGELTGGWISGQFIDNPVPSADTTSTTASGPLGTGATNSYFNFPANVTPASDFGAGAIAQQGVDINVTANGQGAGQALYRSQDGVGNQTATDYLRPKFTAARTKFNDQNIGLYNVGYIAAGNWFNYTRHYPAGYYNIWGRLAFNVNYGLSLGQVTAGVGTATQTVTPLGTFTGNNGAGYQSWQWIPLLDANSNPVGVSLSGQATTFQATALTGINMEFFMLVPARFPLTSAYVAGQLQISFPTDPGYSYQVQYKSSLSVSGWSSVGLPVTGDGTVHTVLESSPGFYQVVATP
jgi:fibronectin type 3 domain-containing protein